MRGRRGGSRPTRKCFLGQSDRHLETSEESLQGGDATATFPGKQLETEWPCRSSRVCSTVGRKRACSGRSVCAGRGGRGRKGKGKGASLIDIISQCQRRWHQQSASNAGSIIQHHLYVKLFGISCNPLYPRAGQLLILRPPSTTGTGIECHRRHACILVLYCTWDRQGNSGDILEMGPGAGERTGL